MEARRVSSQLLQVVHWSGVLVPERKGLEHRTRGLAPFPGFTFNIHYALDDLIFKHIFYSARKTLFLMILTINYIDIFRSHNLQVTYMLFGLNLLI